MELNEQQRVFLDALFGEAEGNVGNALEIAGYHRHYTHILKLLKEEIIERATSILAGHAVGAVIALGDAVTKEGSTTPGVTNRVAAAKEILDRVGMVKQDKLSISSETPVGLFILPAKEKES